MQAYKVVTTVQEKRRLILENIPFRQGQRVEVVVLAAASERNDTIAELKQLFDETQTMPHLQTISEEDIIAEITAYRASQ